jgi:hypothetical protein
MVGASRYFNPVIQQSLLSSTVIDELLRTCGEDQLPTVAYFYFSNKQTQTHLAVRSLISQLSLTTSCGEEVIPAALESLYSWHSEDREPPTIDHLISTLKSLILSHPQPYIVLDALDECEDGDELLRLIQEIHGFGSLHLLATSRTELQITDSICSLDSLKVAMDESRIQDDIRLHIHHTLYHGNQYQEWPQEVKGKVETTLVNGACGM